MKRLFTATALFTALLAIPVSAHAQSIPFDLEIGYRWLDLKGNEDMYRTQINERSGTADEIRQKVRQPTRHVQNQFRLRRQALQLVNQGLGV